jgi:putative transposase
MAIKAVKERGICIRVACQAFRISESCYRYERKLDAENEEVATWLIKLTDNNRNWGFGLCYLYLRNLKGFKWNHKRVYRVYKELELNLRIKPRKAVNSREARGFDSATGNQSSLVNGLYA